MKKYPLDVTKRTARNVLDGAVEPVQPRRSGGAWTSFHYSFTEISAVGATARVKSKRASYENGRLVSESFEGELERGACERMLDEAQRRFFEQAAAFARSLFGLPAPPRKARSEWD